MQIALIGLGRMGGNMARRLTDGGHDVVVWDRNAEAIDAAARAGSTPAWSLDNLVATLKPPRSVSIMVPAGAATASTVRELGARLASHDLVLDGGNSHYKDDVRRAQE
jgi:6-phosphogluconate dehydrogenase